MSYRISLPHHPAGGLCIVNGIRNLIHWRTGRDWSNEFVCGLGQGSGFAYIYQIQGCPATPPSLKKRQRLSGGSPKSKQKRTQN
jgi:hypothetical protein